MQNYKNLDGQSGIVGYEIGDDFIIVKFKEASKSGYTTYKYSYTSAGEDEVEKMKELASSGDGLDEFINSSVRKKYEDRS
ncbi:MAG: hypothetical protein KAR54_02805 [Candidatus Pacebacteria bacterium]|nr:hypothetical protein [Candidatus Paceibacterota bacterium]